MATRPHALVARGVREHFGFAFRGFSRSAKILLAAKNGRVFRVPGDLLYAKNTVARRAARKIAANI